MNERIRELFERHTVPSFSVGDPNVSRNAQGEYNDCVLEDHWQTFQEAFELAVKETVQVVRAGIEYGNGMEDAVYNYFGVEL